MTPSEDDHWSEDTLAMELMQLLVAHGTFLPVIATGMAAARNQRQTEAQILL